MNCQNCNNAPPIQDQGTIWLIALNESVRLQLNNFFMDNELHRETNRSDMLPLSYKSKEQLLKYIQILIEQLSNEEQSLLQIEIQEISESHKPSSPIRLELKTFAARIKHYDLVQVISDHQITSFMQPIVDIHTLQIVAYEFLLRPAEGMPTFQPYELFQVAQQTGLHSFLDRSARISAIEASTTHLKKGMKRFINFLPSSIYNPNYCLSHTFQAIDQYGQDPKDFVFEVVETEKISDIKHLKHIFDVYKQHGVQVALDDVGSGYSTLEVLAELKPDYVKIDRDLISNCDQDATKQKLIADIVQCAQSFGSTVLAEGMEHKQEWEFCKTQQISLAQGYLFGKPAPYPLTDFQVVL